MVISTEEKLKALGELSRFDVTGFPYLFNPQGYLDKAYHFIYPAVGFKGNCVNLFKVLQTNLCQRNCFYCVNRQDRNCKRLMFKPEELVSLFLHFYRRRWVEGLFLSSAVFPEPNQAQERMFITLRLIRQAGFKGFIHSVILPGVDDYLIRKVAAISDRLSLNLEAPSQKYLSRLSPSKDFKKELLKGLEKIALLHKQRPFKAGLTTQLVVGASQESDSQILSLSYNLYKNFNLSRVYYSGFIPVNDTPLEDRPACPPLREARLYQADFLLRRYGFKYGELVFNKENNLALDKDPKLAWALEHPERFPVEINRASKEELLRVPGVGIISCQRILNCRGKQRFLRLEDLKKSGIVVSRVRNFITLAGRMYPSKKKTSFSLSREKQLFLWEEI